MKTSVKIFAIAAALSLSFGLDSAFAKPKEAWVQYGPVYSTAEYVNIASWVNEECKPKTIGDIKLLYSQVAQSYTVHVYCPKGDGGLGRLVVGEYNTPKGGFVSETFMNSALLGTNSIILGWNSGSGSNNTIYYLKEVK